MPLCESNSIGHVVNALGESSGEQDKTPGFTNGPLVRQTTPPEGLC